MSVMRLTQSVCSKLEAGEKRYDVRDSQVRGLFLRVEKSGRKTWYVSYRTPAPERRLRNKKLGPWEITLAQAREAARDFLAVLYLEKVDPAEVRGASAAGSPTLREVMDKYGPWVTSHRKSGATTLRLLGLFHEFLDVPAAALSTKVVERWQNENAGRIRGATVNRRVAALSSMLHWAAREGLIEEVPFKVSKVPQTDSRIIIRYLSPDERLRLTAALEEREAAGGRDYLKTAVVLSLNTGIRKGTLMSLVWEDVNFASHCILLRAAIMKGGKSAIMPLNAQALAALEEWRRFTGRDTGYIFPGDGSRLRDTKRPFERLMRAAKIENFTWHCLRHDFASQLAMKGVPLHVIQRLMCHASIEMTQRYAHLSPNSLEEAVKLLE